MDRVSSGPIKGMLLGTLAFSIKMSEVDYCSITDTYGRK